MRYLSLIELMRFYGHYIEENHALRNLNNMASHKISYDVTRQYNPFIIEPMSIEAKQQGEFDTEQTLNKLTINSSVCSRLYDPLYTHGMIDSIIMPPILELEWLRTGLELEEEHLELEEEQMDVLVQVGYMTVVYLMPWAGSDNMPDTNTTWMEKLEDVGVIIEVDDLKDTATILSQNPLQHIKNMPRIRSWNTFLIYGTDIQSILNSCENQANPFKEIYYHLPVMLSMFMIDYLGSNLTNWKKSVRIGVEHQIQDMIHDMENYRVVPDSVYTYGFVTNITQKDVNLIRDVIGSIYNLLHEINQDIGLISFKNYNDVRGPEIIKASVQLTGLNINWNFEMERVKREKEQAKDVDIEEDDGSFVM